MKFRRLLVALGVMLVIVLLGLYWEGQRVPERTPDEASDETTVNTPDFDTNEWDVAPEATVSVRRGNRVDSPHRNGTFDIPGRVDFPEGATAEAIDLEVEILPLAPSQLDQIKPARSASYQQVLRRIDSTEPLRQRVFTQSVTTDGSGHFSLRKAPPGLYRVRSLDDQWTGRLEDAILQRNSSITPLQFSVTKNATLIGHVVDSNEQPIANATLPFTTSSREVSTNQDGTFKLTRLEPETPVDYAKITKEGFKTHYLDQKPLKPGEVRHDTFVLQESASLTVNVTTSAGQPVRNGKIRLRRLRDDTGADNPGSEPNTKPESMNPLDKNGRARFENLAPGTFRISLAFSNHLTDPETVDVQPGESAERTLTVREGIPIEIRHVNTETDNTVEEVRPRITVLDERGQALRQGFKFKNIGPEGVLEGTVHPSAEKVTIRSESSRFKPKETTVRASDLPDVSISLTPIQSTDDGPNPPGLLKVNLAVNGRFNWEDVVDVQAYVLDATTGQRVLGRAGHRSTFEEPFPLQSGSYVLYGVIKTRADNSFVVGESLSIEGRHPGKKSVTPVRSATLTGRVLLNDKPISDRVTVAVSLLEPESRTQAPTRNVYYPELLSSSPGKNGEFTIRNVPIARSLGLHVISEGGTQLGAQPGAVLISKPIDSLREGEEESVSAINLEQ